MGEKLRSLRFPIGVKLVALFLVVTVAALATATYLTRSRVEDDSLAQSRAAASSRVANSARVLDDYLTAQVGQANIAAAQASVREVAAGARTDAALERARATLSSFQKGNPYYESVSLLDLNGKTIVSSAPNEEGVDLKFSRAFQEGAKGSGYVSDVSVSVVTNSPAIFVAVPVKGQNEGTSGVLQARIALAGIVNQVAAEGAAFGTQTLAVLVDENGMYLATNDPGKNVTADRKGMLLTSYKDLPEELRAQWVGEKRFGASSRVDTITVTPDAALAGLVDGGAAGAGAIDGADGSREVAFASLTTKPWKYVVSVPSAVVTAPARSTANQLTLIALIGAAIAAVLAFLFSLTITRPIVRLAKVADAVSMGQTDVAVEAGSNDELGDLAQSLNRMVISVRYYMKRDAAQQAAAEEDELAA